MLVATFSLLAFLLAISTCDLSAAADVVNVCPYGWSSYDRKCFFVGHGTKLNKETAEMLCSNQFSSLAFITSEEENNFVKSLLSSESSGETEAIIAFFEPNGSSYYQTETYTDWAAGVETQGSIIGDCAIMSRDHGWSWVAGDCLSSPYSSMLYVCGSISRPYIMECTHDSCYGLGRSPVFSGGAYLPEYDSECRLYNGHLATIESTQENEFVKKFLMDAAGSLSEAGINEITFRLEGVHIAGEFNDGEWSLSGENMTFFDWAQNERPMSARFVADRCIVLNPYKDFAWTETDCLWTHVKLCEFET